MLKTTSCFLILINLCLIHSLYAQSDSIPSIKNPKQEEIFRPDKFNSCWGIGTNYGGTGTNLLVYPNKYTGIFAGFGFTQAGAAFNVGIKGRYIKDTITFFIQPFIILSYGTNFMVIVENEPSLNNSFKNFTAGTGIDIRPKFMDPVSFSFSILYPFKSKKVQDYKNKMVNDYYVVFYKESLFVISLGINFRIK